MAAKRRRAVSQGALKKVLKRPAAGPRSARGSALWELHSASSELLDPALAEEQPRELLRRFLAPLQPEEFRQHCWSKVAVAVHGSEKRMKAIVRGFLHDLNLDALLAETPSERVHAWVAAPSGAAASAGQAPTLDSVAVDAEAALGLGRAGAALYFRAPEELENALVPGICNALGAGFAGFYPGDGKPRGEIETFVASQGHVTGWHTDFQHNFTFQLKGSKTWKFKKGPVEHNVRALTPHYRSRSNYEQQMKLHLLSDPSSPEFRPPEEFFGDAEEVTLHAGSVLYHPAGIWHHVQSASDSSISINVSLTCATWADVVGDALRQIFWSSPNLRAPALGLADLNLQEARAVAEERLKEVRRCMNSLTAEDLLPPAMLDVPRLPRRIHLGSSRLGASFNVQQGDSFRFSHLAVLMALPPSADASSSDSEADARASRYVLHANFGNEDIGSWLRVEILVPDALSRAVEWLVARHLQRQKGRSRASGSRAASDFTAKELLSASLKAKASGGKARASTAAKASAAHWGRIARLIRVLRYCGYLQTP